MTAALDCANSALSAGSCASAKAAGTSCWKKLMMPGSCSMAISVKMRGGFWRLACASARTRGICFSRAIRERRRSSAGANLRSMRVKAAFGAGAGVVVGVLGPGADRLEREQVRADVRRAPSGDRRASSDRARLAGIAEMRFSKSFRAATSASMLAREKSSSLLSYW